MHVYDVAITTVKGTTRGNPEWCYGTSTGASTGTISQPYDEKAMMINVKVSTIWQGEVGINEEHYIKPALETRQGLYITLTTNGEVMEIPADKVYTAILGYSRTRYHDKYGGPDYLLVYYKWVPTAKQMMLI